MTQVEHGVEYTPIAPEVLEDPAAAYAVLRAQCPIHRSDDLGRPLYSLSRHADIAAVLRDHGTWSNRYGAGVALSMSGVGDMQHDDPPEHERRREFARAWFVPPTVAPLEPQLRALAESLADAMAPRGRADLYADFALPLPVTSFCAVMGVEISDRDQFVEWADEMTTAMAYPGHGDAARRALNAFTAAEIERRRAIAADGGELPEGLFSHLATAPYTDDGEPMAINEVVGMVNQLLIAGHETTTSLITNCVWRLLEDRPNRWERVVADPSLIRTTVEESLRFDPPVLGLCRTNNDEVTLHGVTLPVDSKLMVLYRVGEPRRSHLRRAGRLPRGPSPRRVDAPLLVQLGHPPLPRRPPGPAHGAGGAGGAHPAPAGAAPRRRSDAHPVAVPVGPQDAARRLGVTPRLGCGRKGARC